MLKKNQVENILKSIEWEIATFERYPTHRNTLEVLKAQRTVLKRVLEIEIWAKDTL